MIDPNDVTVGERIAVEIVTVYQDFPTENNDVEESPEPYDFAIDVAEIERDEDRDEGAVITDLYLDRYDDDGNFDRRIRFHGADPEYQQGRGSGTPDEKTWAQMSRDGYCLVREATEDDEPIDADSDDEDADEADESPDVDPEEVEEEIEASAD
jgi:hypothetical protein